MKIVFIRFVNNKDIKFEDVQKLITICLNYFTHIYLININKFKKYIPLKIKVNNAENDLPGIYNIDEINNNIRCYSVQFVINDLEFSVKDENVNINFKHIFMSKNFNFNSFEMEIKFYLNAFFNKPDRYPLKKASVLVIDLDDTIINRNGDLIIENFYEYLKIIKRTFTYVVLWSHGCQQHVNHIFQTTLKDYNKSFDMIIAKNSSVQLNNKGIGYLLKVLNEKFNVEELTVSILVDDQKLNYNNDYDYFLHVPKGLTYEAYNKEMWSYLYKIQKKLEQKINIL